MPEISFALLPSTTIKKCKLLKVENPEAVIKVSGRFSDPNSLQRFRDGVSQSFESHREKLSQLVLSHEKRLGEAEGEDERDRLMKEFNRQLEVAIGRTERTLQEKIDAFQKKAAEGAMAQVMQETKFKVSIVWSAYKLTSAALSYFLSQEEGNADDGTFLEVAKAVYDSLKELVKLAKTLYALFQSEQDVRSQIETTRKQIRNSKGKPVESLVDRLESQLKAHGMKIAALEKSARDLATYLQELLKEADRGSEELKDDLSEVIDKSINQIISMNEGVDKAKDYHGRSQDALRDARKKAVKDPSSWWDYFKKIDEWYEAVDDWFNKHKVKNLEEQLEYAMDNIVKQFIEGD